MIADVNIGIAFLAGVLSFLSPCTLPLVPSYLSYITGLVYDQLVDDSLRHVYRRRIIIHSCLFIIGFSIAFISLGFSFSVAGVLLSKYQYWIKKIGGLLIIFFGLFIILSFRIPFLLKDHMINLKTKPTGYVGSLLVGLVFAVGWTPCVGPILGSILLIAGTQQEMSRALVLMIAYSLGLGLPFLLCALAIDRFFITFTRLRRFMPAVTTASGILLMFVGVLVFTDKLQAFGYMLLRWVPSLEM